MKSFREFNDMPFSFWGNIRFTSEALGYSRGGLVTAYPEEKIYSLYKRSNYNISEHEIDMIALYCEKRAALLNGIVKDNLMDAVQARNAYNQVRSLYDKRNIACKIPMNKQKGDMKQVAYFTAIINMIAEIKFAMKGEGPLAFDDDPHGLVYLLDNEGKIIGATSRRYDGAYPSIINPKMVWEIKEYYYATTFGSRVADGVYETQLDGYEFRQLQKESGRFIIHVYFIDAYKTWWEQGKSYLCRIIDALNMGLVDEVIVGREVLTRWPILISECCKE